MGSIIKRIVKRLNIWNDNNIIKDSLSTEESIQLGKAHNFHGNNKVHNSTIGQNSYVSYNSIIYHTEIGDYCSIGPNVVSGYGDHPLNMISTSPNIYLNDLLFEPNEKEEILTNHFKKVIIKNDVWIGANVYIKKGVEIGTGAIIGAGSVVLNNVGDYEIVAGVPARLIKSRFSDEVVKLLIKIKWWNLDFNILREHKQALFSPNEINLKELLNKLENDKKY